jgi:hypothetical protein
MNRARRLLCLLFGHRITGRAWIGSKGCYESYCSRCDRNLPGAAP